MAKKVIYLVCIMIVIAEILFLKILHYGHAYFSFEEMPAFGAIIGFLGSLFIVVVAKTLSRVITRKEDYYD
ncbi:MAG TPA: hypothetical protein PKZ17_02745 [Thermodesulfovibrio thiophilus]|uniref:hypothetical protein n=1 Tax=Thermodesulfovibrio thiophilus TaxID=340095 RepID=UPI000412E202|nr:hypothetical protein [Thermodesulfovibrio thiophilus]HHW19571.1 hypothetical protein [Thermodesulfovibrio thiophilus]HOA82380.1 hypothetical protein [Thermodesulfovibrio thiophilus]HQA03638.1 hypothetical protein [Thermodesulfovibrio thiophilus]HQD35817.1 hypothetical protein [Thermodesulfovibrio thiophilus]